MLSAAATTTPEREHSDDRVGIHPGMTLPLPDEVAAMATRQRLAMIDIGVAAPTVTALGVLAETVAFVASVQGTSFPRPFLSTRVVLLTGSHAGGVVAGPAPDPKNSIPLQHLAVTAGAGIVTLEWQPASAAIELEDAITPDQMEAALQAGWDEADRAADEGIELLVLAAGGAGAAAAASAVVAAVTGVEVPMLLSRVVTPAGRYDDNAWMTRCVALRDALHRVRGRASEVTTVLTALGGADIAAATGLILGAAHRRTPIMIDGPVGAAAGLLANEFSPQSRSWLLLPDTNRHPAVRLAAEALELRPWLDLCLDLGEGAGALAALPMLQTALTLASVGEQVEEQPLTRYDSSGNQVFVGIAKPVEPTDDEHAAADPDAVTARDAIGATDATKTVEAPASEQAPGAVDHTPPAPVDATPVDATPVDATPVDATPVDAPTAAVSGGNPRQDSHLDEIIAAAGAFVRGDTAEVVAVSRPVKNAAKAARAATTKREPEKADRGDETPGAGGETAPTPATPKPIEPASVKNEPAADKSAQPEATAPDARKPAAAKPVPVKAEPAKSEPAKGTPTRTVTKAPPARSAGSRPAQTKTVPIRSLAPKQAGPGGRPDPDANVDPDAKPDLDVKPAGTGTEPADTDQTSATPASTVPTSTAPTSTESPSTESPNSEPASAEPARAAATSTRQRKRP